MQISRINIKKRLVCIPLIYTCYDYIDDMINVITKNNKFFFYVCKKNKKLILWQLLDN